MKRLRIDWDLKLAKVRRLQVPCAVCHENDAHSDVKTARPDVSCMGNCRRKFHVECLRMADVPDCEWKCPDCAPAVSSTILKSPWGRGQNKRRSYQTRASTLLLSPPMSAKGSTTPVAKIPPTYTRDPREILWVQALIDMCQKGGPSTASKVRKILDGRKFRAPLSREECVSDCNNSGLTAVGAVLRAHSAMPHDFESRKQIMQLLMEARVNVAAPFADFDVVRGRNTDPINFCMKHGRRMDHFMEMILLYDPSLYFGLNIQTLRKNFDPVPEHIIRETLWRRRKWLIQARLNGEEILARNRRLPTLVRGVLTLPDEIFRHFVKFI